MPHPLILVVDDEPLNLEIIAEFLEDDAYRLEFAATGEEAWSLLEVPDSAYDLVVLDRMMPGMNGIELLKRIKADARLAHLPVIMQTAAAAPDQVREGLSAGAYYYLTKPYDPEALQTIVRAALDDARNRALLEESGRAQIQALQWLSEARFVFRTLEEAREVGIFLSGLCPVPDVAVIGLVELLVNAVEHGNLGMSYAEKTRTRQEGTWEQEIQRRLALPEYRERRAEARLERLPEALRFTISDAGAGFDWLNFLDFDPGRAFDPNGRGIAMARHMSFSLLEYQGCGNVVVACIRHGAPKDADVPSATATEGA